MQAVCGKESEVTTKTGHAKTFPRMARMSGKKLLKHEIKPYLMSKAQQVSDH
jgi:hypothetical protein